MPNLGLLCSLRSIELAIEGFVTDGISILFIVIQGHLEKILVNKC